jgi:MraZ protein
MSAGFYRRSDLINRIELMFVGRCEHTIDEKGRLIIPVHYRPLLEIGAFITSGFDQNLMVMTSPIFDKVHEQISQMNLTDPLSRQLRRLIFSNAERVELDRAGRDLAQLNGNAIINGVHDYFEIWSPVLWQRQNELLNADADSQRYSVFTLSLG